MRYATINNLQIPKIEFRPWSIGGHSSADTSSDEAFLNALRPALKLGYSRFDTAEMYAGGHSGELLGRAIREEGLPRENLLRTSKVSTMHLKYNNVLHRCESSLRRLVMDYLGLYLIHWSMAAGIWKMTTAVKPGSTLVKRRNPING